MQRSARYSRCRCGFTLIETMLAALLLSLLFLAAMDLYLSGLQAVTKSGSQISANSSSANGLQHIEQDVREAYFFVLPSTTPTPTPEFGSDLGPGYTTSSFQTTYLDPSIGASRTINTGLKLVFPAVKPVTVYKSSGAQLPLTRYDLSTAGTAVYIYRADMPAQPNSTVPATPDPALGDCLWASGSESGTPINQCLAKLSDSRSAAGGITTANTLPNAVEFSQPPEPNSLQVRLISSYFSPISSQNNTLSSQQSSESNQTLLVGKCVYMNDHQQKSN